MALNLILLGPPASGKGTQGRRLAESLGLAYLSTGALLREAVAAGTPAGREVEPVLARGGYVPDQLMGGILTPWLEQHPGGWVLDGYPRTLAQDDFLRGWLARRGGRVDAAVSLEVPVDELVRRIERRVECATCRWSGQRGDLDGSGRCPECGGEAGARSDDTLDNFRSRHAEFESHTLPVVARYREAGLLLACDATAPVAEVSARLLQLVRSLLSHGSPA